MGTYLNPGKRNYQISINSDIYIDKSEMIMYLNSVVNTQQRFVSVSRPRRFGKSMAADMLCAYYDREADSRGLFEKRKLAQCTPIEKESGQIRWDTYLGGFDVVRIVITKFFRNSVTVDKALEKMQRLVIREYKRVYPEIELLDENDLVQTFDDIYSVENRQVVIVIDEWDAPFRERKDDKEGQKEYLDFLRDLMKDNSHVALAYMTGILPIKKYGKHSALNMFTEYSIMFPRQLAQYTGFTEGEVKDLTVKYGRDFGRMKDWYDGYTVRDIIPPDPDHQELKVSGTMPVAAKYHLYCPLSVVEATTTGVVKDYWNKTENYEALAEYIRKDYDGLKEAVALLMDGGRLEIDTSTYQNDMTTFTGRDDVLSLLIHLGYMGYDDAKSEVFIPNKEILDEFKASTKGEEWTDTFKAFDTSLKLLEATWKCDSDTVAEMVEDAHNIASNKTYHDEAALSYGIQLAYYAARKYYTTIQELDTGKGYADLVFVPAPQHAEKPLLLIELKYGKSTKAAMDQVRRQKYLDRFEHYKGNILIIGINYDRDLPNTSPEFKHHSCIIEKA